LSNWLFLIKVVNSGLLKSICLNGTFNLITPALNKKFSFDKIFKFDIINTR